MVPILVIHGADVTTGLPTFRQLHNSYHTVSHSSFIEQQQAARTAAAQAHPTRHHTRQTVSLITSARQTVSLITPGRQTVTTMRATMPRSLPASQGLCSLWGHWLAQGEAH